MGENKKILCFTGTRADYGIYRPFLFEIEKCSFLDVQLVVTGMHLLEEYGKTINELREDPFYILSTPSILLKGDSRGAMSKSIGLATIYFADIIDQAEPDAILILGDRGEMLSAAISAHYLNVLIFHLHGGEKSGSADDAVRHAISKLSNFHFVSSFESKIRLISMQEKPSNIFVIGSLRKHDIQKIKNMNDTQKQFLSKKLKLSGSKKKILFIMHPDSKESTPISSQINTTLAALREFTETQLILLGTNSDAGGEVFSKYINEFVAQNKNATYFHSLPADEYLFLLSQVNVLVGNSSSGIIEAPFFNLPFINIGNRQKNREHGDNVLHVDYNSSNIKKKIQKALSQINSHKKNPYNVVNSPAEEMIKFMDTLFNEQNK
ncbi:UDP-N-acetylglucosamine 2-epimerase (hydrolyzing) [Salipaludibacillus neizhouensis]|uniref:UDP-N-acetylglucosamine 2-epimerase (Hydrolyzing) n=1 Tax=Salipaludibacillus neizhouensis TaxID=885475 RepID=A0A3A9KEW5_9BACI|nr:UDP-N-acetylglucosamine 2-epimerase [Salipaludibacillus neizhouensis]RKL69112.1 UDP-N-acetylglucosamine 2-epimerase (hydrolyzing) [Salipaludibacillus neizhouensis]